MVGGSKKCTKINIILFWSLLPVLFTSVLNTTAAAAAAILQLF